MDLSRKWLAEFVDSPADDKEYCDAMTLSGSKVEGVTVEGTEIRNVVVGKVLAMERLEGIGLSGDDLMEMTEALSGDFMEMVGPMMAAAVHGEDAAMAQAEALAAPSGAAPAGEEASQPVDIFS